MHNLDPDVTGCDNAGMAHIIKVRKAWENDDWFYCGIVLSAERDGWTKDHLASLWGIECNYPDSDNSYLLTVANELLAEYIENNKG